MVPSVPAVGETADVDHCETHRSYRRQADEHFLRHNHSLFNGAHRAPRCLFCNRPVLRAPHHLAHESVRRFNRAQRVQRVIHACVREGVHFERSIVIVVCHTGFLSASSSARRCRAEYNRDLTVFTGSVSDAAISSYESSVKCRSSTTSR